MNLASPEKMSAPADHALNIRFSCGRALEATGLARLLRHGTSSEAQARLVELLEYKHTEGQTLAAQRLAAIGTASVVEALPPYTKGMFESGTLKDAITTIQSRLSGADHGQVSVVSVQDDLGAVSVERTQGEVSLEEESV